VACGGGYTVGPVVAGGGGAFLVRGEERGGERVGYLRVVVVAAVCVADFTALDVEDPILNQLGCKRTQFQKIEDEVRWELTLRELWRSLEMVMSSFDEAKFSAWGTWSASSSFTRLNPPSK
jgi:hypothetical protein